MKVKLTIRAHTVCKHAVGVKMRLQNRLRKGKGIGKRICYSSVQGGTQGKVGVDVTESAVEVMKGQ
jgi:hypothetical protein